MKIIMLDESDYEIFLKKIKEEQLRISMCFKPSNSIIEFAHKNNMKYCGIVTINNMIFSVSRR